MGVAGRVDGLGELLLRGSAAKRCALTAISSGSGVSKSSGLKS